jgi:hypothetical protein
MGLFLKKSQKFLCATIKTYSYKLKVDDLLGACESEEAKSTHGFSSEA